MPSLTNPRWEMFCQEYLVDLNASKAYRRVYPDSSEESARRASSELLTNLDVSSRIEELKLERISRIEVKQDEVLQELLILLKSNVDHYTLDESGKISLKENAPSSALRAVSSVKHKVKRSSRKDSDYEEVETEYRLWDKPKAVELSMKHLGLTGTDKLEVTLNAQSKEMMQRVVSAAFEYCAEENKAALAEKIRSIAGEYSL